MDGDFQDNYVLNRDQDNSRRAAHVGAVTCVDRVGCGAAGHQRRVRERISSADAAAIRQRVSSCADALHLRGSRALVLTAVLALTCGYKRLGDDAVALRHVAARIPGGRTLDPKTIGRALRWLAGEELVVYRAARGRGTTAYIGIHPRFTEGVSVLARDAAGRVIRAPKPPEIVTFSQRPYKEIISKKYNNPPTPQRPVRQAVADTRPTGVEISTTDTVAVLSALPGALGELTGKPRWRLGEKIRDRLRAGWLPEQILEVLAAPMPTTVAAPSALGIWRLAQNMPGPGPRLRPLQQAWDRRQSSNDQQAAAATTARWYQQVLAVTSIDERVELLRADEVKFGRPSASPVAALAAAGRRAARLHPGLGLGEALRRWAADVFSTNRGRRAAVVKQPATVVAASALLRDLAIGDRCVVCDQHAGSPRPQLPLMSTVCDHCWPMIAAELADGGAVDCA